MRIVSFDPSRHYAQVAALWETALPEPYRVTDRVLQPRLWLRPDCETGDVLVALDRNRVVALAVTEFHRAALVPARGGTIEAVVVHPRFRRQGLGRQLVGRAEARLRALGCSAVNVSSGLFRFWSGVPEDLPEAGAFFAACGYRHDHDVIDMLVPPADDRPLPDPQPQLDRAGATVGPVAAAEFGAVYDLLTREAAGWRESLVQMAAHGDLGNALAVRHGTEIIGQVQTFTPASRYRSANLVWERFHGADLGGFGAVLVAPAWRQHGLGLAMCQAALRHVREHGGRACLIDWTNDRLAPFYRKLGAEVCGRFRKYAKDL